MGSAERRWLVDGLGCEIAARTLQYVFKMTQATLSPVRHSAPVLTPAGGGARTVRRPILVVDDDASVTGMVLAALEFEGFPAVGATDGAAALAALDQVDPCLILLDMRMPVMDGWEFARRYAQRPGPRAPVVVMTAAQDAARWAREVGADAVLPKPFDLDELDAIIKRFC